MSVTPILPFSCCAKDAMLPALTLTDGYLVMQPFMHHHLTMHCVLYAYHVQLFLMTGTSKQGDTPVDTAIDDSRVDHPENHAVGDPGNVHMESPGDIIDCADDADPKSPEDHD